MNDEVPAGERVFEDLKSLGAIGDLDRLVNENEIDEVIIAESDVTSRILA